MTQTLHPKSAVFFVLIAVMINAVSFGLMIPVLPDLLKELSGLDNSQAVIYGGWLTFIYALMQFIFMPFIGALSDRYGRRPIMLLSLLGLSIDYFIMALAPTIAFLFLGRIFAGIFGATFSTANAYMADISPPEKRAQNFALVGAVFGVGFMIGPVIGGVLGDYGPRIPFLAAGIVGLINVALGVICLPETLTRENRRAFEWARANPLGAIRQIRKLKGALSILMVMFLLALAHTAYPTTYTFSMNEGLNWNSRDVGLSLGAFGFASLIVQGGLIRIIIPKIGLFWAAAFGILSFILAFMGFGFARAGWVIYAMGIFAAFAGLYGPSLNNMMSSRLGKSEQGELQGAIGAMQGLAMMAGPLMMTNIFKHFTQDGAPLYLPGAPFVFGAGLSMIGLLILFITTTKDERKNRITHPS